MRQYDNNYYIKNKNIIKSLSLKRYYDLKEKRMNPKPIIDIKYENVFIYFN